MRLPRALGRALGIALALTLGSGVSDTNLQAQVSQGPTSSVTIDVLVVDSLGRRIETLAASDFSVAERGVPLRVASVRFVRAAPSGAAGTDGSAVTASTRLFGILLDEYHVSPGPGAERVRQALMRFVRDRLAPGDMVAVIRPLDSLLNIQLTADRSVALKAIEAFDPRLGDYLPRSSFERDFIAGAPARIDAARAQISASALDALATHLGRFLPLRKTLLMVTEGVVGGAGRGNAGRGPAAWAMGANRGHVAIYPVDPSSGSASDPGSGPSSDAVGDQRPAAASPDSGGGSAVEALRTLAADTSGRTLPGRMGASVVTGRGLDVVLHDSRDQALAVSPAASLDDALNGSLDDALADASGYYAVTVDVPLAHGVGQLHPVDISVSRPDASVRARKGYWSEPDDVPPPPSGPAGGTLLSAFSSQVLRHSSPLIRPWFGMSRGEAGTTSVSFVWEPAPRVPGDRVSGPVPARVGLTVSTLDGQTIYRGPIRASTAEAPGDGSEPTRARFDAPTGRLLVQMVIEDQALRVVDRDARDLLVGGFSGPVALGTAEFFRARNAREFHVLSTNPDATPVALRQFSRAERLLIRVPVFSTGDRPEVSARLLSGFGAVMRELRVDPTPSRPDMYQVEVALASLAAGSYSIDVTAKNPNGESHDRLPIRVTP